MSIALFRTAFLAAALSLCACRDAERAAPGGEPADPGAPAAESAVPANRPLPAPAEPLARDAEPAPAPTAADSAAAAREDVSPEWKQRARSMGSHAQCMQQAAAAPPEGRPRLEEACSRLPDAPR